MEERGYGTTEEKPKGRLVVFGDARLPLFATGMPRPKHIPKACGNGTDR